ncbi:MAG: hypothetical protein Q4G44_02070 [Alcaligenaceae bacterium]|nr:hypothetical protein [Alcaligenaceae bacterium]
MNSVQKRNLLKTCYVLLTLCLAMLLTACQDKTWHVLQLNPEGFSIEAQFPNQPMMLERPYQLLDEQSEEPMTMVQWFAAVGENSFNLSYLLVPAHLDPALVVNELLRSMSLKRDPRLLTAPPQFVEEYEQDLPALGEQFRVSIGADSKHLVASAKVLQEGRLIVQLYTAGPEGDKNFLKQSQRFFEELKIGATID